jgi:hypothetical protein
MLSGTVVAVAQRQARTSAWLRTSAVATAAIAAAHVWLVWSDRFGWSVRFAWEKSAAGFLIFHAALALLVAAAVAPEQWTRRLLLAAFPVVTLGAVGAVLRNEVVAMYRAPVVATAALAVVLSFVAWKRRARSAAARG